jgi:hypothetical protein
MITILTPDELRKYDGKILNKEDFKIVCACETVKLYEMNVPVVKTEDGIALDIFYVKLEDNTYITVSRDSRDYYDSGEDEFGVII